MTDTQCAVVKRDPFSTLEFTREQIDTIKRTYAVGATDDELKIFIATAARSGLDPLQRQRIRWQPRRDDVRARRIPG